VELSEIAALITDPAKLVSAITDLAPEIPEQATNFQPEQHKVVTDLTYRPDRKVDVPTGVLDDQGKPIYRQEIKPVHRIPSATQKLIIDWSVDLALSAGVDIDCTPREGIATDETMLAMVKKTLEDNKFDYLAMEIERLKQRYLTVLLVWYSVPAEDGYWDGIGRKDSRYKMRCVILSPEDGDIIIPIRDQYKDMIGAARKYKVKIDGKDVEKMDLFLSDKYMTFVQSTTGWVLEKPATPIPYGKANFILDEQKRTEHADVDAKIERVEEIDSDTADENQQSAFPILLARGDIVAAAGGGASNTRKTFQMEGDNADLKYVESKGGQQSASDERKNIRTDIFIETATPDLKFEDISGDLPGVTIEMMLLPSTNKAKRKHKGSIGIFHQRNLNFLKSAMAVINTDVKPSLGLVMKPAFKIELPRNYTEEYTNIVSLVGAGLMSKETAIKQLGFTANPEDEYERIKAEAAEAAKLVLAAALPPVDK
jgi:SPP1 family phage portal protein